MATESTAAASARANAEAIATPSTDHIATDTAGAQSESTGLSLPPDVKVKKVGKRTVESIASSTQPDQMDKKVRALADEEAERKAKDPNHIEYRAVEDLTPTVRERVGGTGFVVGYPKGQDGSVEVTDAVMAAADDNRLRAENPNGVVYRQAGTSGDVGGESFEVGFLPDAK